MALCSICGLRPASVALDGEVENLARLNVRDLPRVVAACPSCAGQFRRALHYFAASAEPGDGLPRILPTPVRVGASARFRARGVTVAFLDAGFHAHADLVTPKDRIAAYVDVTNPRARRRDLETPDESSWHGMMTSVVACGNGALSAGMYRGIASEARVVLVKCGTARRVKHDDIRRGFEWVVKHRKRYGIRIVNVSVGGDYEASYLSDGLSRAVEAASAAGILVCAAVGNLGHVAGHPVLPPASAPSALTVGGVDDKNRLHHGDHDMYHSSFGPTIDGLQKPEILAPGIWVAAPILPGTPTADEAALLDQLLEAPDAEMASLLARHAHRDATLDAARSLPPPLVRQLVAAKLHDAKVISGSYKHVDGTSFAAPIVSSVAAQMIEADSTLRPNEVKAILVRTARRMPRVPFERQGFGVVDPRAALAAVLRRRRASLDRRPARRRRG